MNDMGYGAADRVGRAAIDELNKLAREARKDFDYAAARRYLDAADRIRTGQS